MSGWVDLTLIGVLPALPGEETTDENGFPLPKQEIKKEVFANKKSVGMNEFYKSEQMGYTDVFKFEVYAYEYDGETFAEYEGKRYIVVRTYAKDGDFIELTLSDLHRRAE